MGIKKFVFVVDNDVFTIFQIDSENPANLPIIAGMQSGPIVVETDNDMVDVGWKYIDGEFYMPARFLAPTQEPDYEVDDD